MLINPLNAELNLICHLLALVGAHHILHVKRIRDNIVLGHILEMLSKQSTKNNKPAKNALKRKVSRNIRITFSEVLLKNPQEIRPNS
jgi:hypothetical protein